MKVVTLTTDMRPWRKGDRPVLPDLLADKLVKSGEATDPTAFPPQDDPHFPAVAKPETRPAKRYFTRKVKP
jgi:hypothetical protein